MKKILPLVIAVLAVAGCTPNNKRSKRTSSTDEDTSANISSVESTSINSEAVSSVISSQTNPSSATPTTASSNTSTGASSSSKPSSSSTSVTPSGELPNNYTKFDPPTNSPVEITTSLSPDDWWNNDLTTDFPNNDWAHIYGYNLTNPSIYANDAGGIKMDQKYKGIRTPLFHHTGPKLEIRMDISQVNNAGGTPDKSVPTGYFFFYNANGDYLSNLTHTVEQETIVKNTTQVKFYVTGTNTENVAYLEFRLNALTFKGSQNYNFGVGGLNIHSWSME